MVQRNLLHDGIGGVTEPYRKLARPALVKRRCKSNRVGVSRDPKLCGGCWAPLS